ncbi:hypothetical protein ACLOJK_036498 [Asimina triloba]
MMLEGENVGEEVDSDFKGPRAFPNPKITVPQPVLPCQEEARSPSTPPQRPPEEMTDAVPVAPLTEPVGTIAVNTERPVTRAEFSALTELLRTLQQQLAHSRRQLTLSTPSDALPSESSIIPTMSPPAEPIATASVPAPTGDYPQT